MSAHAKPGAAAWLTDKAARAVVCLIVTAACAFTVLAIAVLAAWDLADRLRGAAPREGARQQAGAAR